MKVKARVGHLGVPQIVLVNAGIEHEECTVNKQREKQQQVDGIQGLKQPLACVILCWGIAVVCMAAGRSSLLGERNTLSQDK